MTTEATSPRIPRLVRSCDVRRLPLTPAQGYVLSRIDGTASVPDLCLMTGLSRDEVDNTLVRLVELGAVTMGDTPPVTTRSQPAEGNKVAAEALSAMKGPIVETYTIPPAADDGEEAPSLYDPSELDEDVDIPPDRRRRILDLFYRLDDLTYYEVLSVEHSADKKRIKEAYFALAAEFHPDRYFRKNLGSFKQKMEAVFSKITLAHDTLSKKTQRAEYDAYIETQLQTRMLEASMRGSDPGRELESLRKAMAERAAPEPIASTPPPAPGADVGRDATRPPPMDLGPTSNFPPPRVGSSSAPPEREVVRSAPPPDSAGGYASVPPRDPDRDRIRRELLARRLMGGRTSKPPAPTPPPPPSRAAAEYAAADLKRRYAERQAAIRRAQLKEAVRMAEEATRREDPTGAANAYRLALELAPDDPEIQKQLWEAQQQTLQVLAKSYLKQARYEEKAERWKDAARSYARVADVLKGDAEVQERTANAMVRADMDLHLAAQMANRAVELEPKEARFRVTLARIYIAAGLKLNARRELEIAAEIAPGDANIARLLKTVG